MFAGIYIYLRSISIVNSVSTSYEDSQQEMQLKCVSQSDELDTMMQNVSQSVEMVYSIAVAKLEHAASFRTSRDYVDTYTKQMLPILMQSAQNTKGALTAYIRYNPEFTEPTSGLFLTRDNSDSEFESVTPTDFPCMIRVMWSMSDGIIFRYRMEKKPGWNHT